MPKRDELGYLKDDSLKVVEFNGTVGVAPAWLAEVLEHVRTNQPCDENCREIYKKPCFYQGSCCEHDCEHEVKT